MNANERVKELRKELELTQADFGERIGLKQAVIGQMENGSRNLTDRTIILICEKYSVNENWLRTGKGEMFIESDSTIVSQLSAEYGLDGFEKAMIQGYLKMQPEQRKAVKSYVKSLLTEIFNNDDAYKEFREEYDTGRALPFAARGGDTSGLAEAADLYDNAPAIDDENDGM